MADQTLDETLLTHGSTSPFLPDTFIQYDRVREKILELHKQGFSRKEIAAKLYISESTVWNHISEKGLCYE